MVFKTWTIGREGFIDSARVVKTCIINAMVAEGIITEEEANYVCDNYIVTYEKKPLISKLWKWVKKGGVEEEPHEYIVSKIVSYSGPNPNNDHNRVLAREVPSKIKQVEQEETNEEVEENK